MADEANHNGEANQGTGVEEAQQAGRRLKKAREAAGIHVNDMAGRLRLTASQVQALEEGRFEQFGASIYVRGYLGNYARQVGLKPGRVLSELHLQDDRPPLRAAAGIPPSRRFASGLARWATYAAGTVVVVLPIVWWASEGTLRLMPGGGEETSPVAGVLPEEEVNALAQSPAIRESEPQAANERRVLASLAPVRAPRQEAGEAAPSGAPGESEAGSGQAPEQDAGEETAAGRVLVLELDEDSWVELHDADGQRLEYNLLRAGSVHEYEGVPPFRLLVGNAGGVRVRYNDSPFDFAPFVQGNLARFQVGEPEDPPAGG